MNFNTPARRLSVCLLAFPCPSLSSAAFIKSFSPGIITNLMTTRTTYLVSGCFFCFFPWKFKEFNAFASNQQMGTMIVYGCLQRLKSLCKIQLTVAGHELDHTCLFLLLVSSSGWLVPSSRITCHIKELLKRRNIYSREALGFVLESRSLILNLI